MILTSCGNLKLLRKNILKEIFLKMRYAWLQPTNVVKIARGLLQLDKIAFSKKHQDQAMSQMINLEEILYHYIWPKNELLGLGKRSRIEDLERIMHQLMQHTHHLLSLLTPKMRTKLQQSLKEQIEVNE
jgi:hypothetical protein